MSLFDGRETVLASSILAALLWVVPAAAQQKSAPPDFSWKAGFGAAWLSGIGFTMSLFIAGLAFGDGALPDMAKIGTMAASLAAGTCGSMILLRRPILSDSPVPRCNSGRSERL